MGASCFSVSGNPAVVRSPNVAKIQNLKVHFPPIQEGSGTPSPSNIRPFALWTSIDAYQASVNIWDEVAEVGFLNGSTGQNESDGSYGVRSVNYIPVIPGSVIRVYYELPNEQDYRSNIRLFWYDENKTYIKNQWSSRATVSVPDTACYLRFYGDSAFGGRNCNISINYPSIHNGYMSYTEENVVPVTLSATGKNLIHTKYPSRESSGITFTVNADWSITTSGTATARTWLTPNLTTQPQYLTHLSPGTYFLSGGISHNEYVYLGGVDENGTVLSFPSDSGNGIKYTIDRDVWVYPQICVTNGTSSNRTFHIQLERGSSATEYESYYETSEFYGGYVDLADGKIVAEWKKKTFTDPTQWVENSNGNFSCYEQVSDKKFEGTSYNFFCDSFNPVYQDTTGNPYIRFAYTTSRNVSIIKNGSPLTLDDVKFVVSNGGISICYPTTTPITYYLPAKELETLRGASSYWSSANDSVDVTYEVADSIEMLKAKKRMVANAPHFEQVEPNDFGDILRFDTNMKAPLKLGGAIFVPSQAGSGDASESNVRSVIGRNAVITKRTRKNLAKVVGFSAVGIANTECLRSSAYRLSNNYGTTISGVTGDSFTVTQANYSDTPKDSYLNGYVGISFHGLEFDRSYKISFRVTNITNNPLNASLSDFKLYCPYGAGYGSPTVIGDRVIFRYEHRQKRSDPDQFPVDIRICGMSATFSEFMVTSLDEEDQTYEPYEDHIGKNLFYCSANDKEQAGGKFVRNLDGTVTCSGMPTGYCTIELGQAFVSSSMGNVRISGLASASNVGWDIIALYDETKTLVADFPEVGGSQSDKTIDLSSYPTAKYLVLAIKCQSNGVGMSGVVKPQVELGATTTDFEPYCDDSFPIAISTPGKNLYPFRHETYTTTVYSNGYVWAGQPWKITDRTVKYTFSAYFDNTNGDRPCHVTIWMRNADNSDWADETARTGTDIAAGSSGYSAVSIDFSNNNYPNTYYLCFGGALAGNAIIYRPMVELGSYRTEYEPYNESVYGAYVNWTEGIMAITHQCVEIPFEKEWSEQDIYFAKYQSNAGTPKFSSAIKDFLVSHHKNAVGIAGSVYINSSGHILFGKTFASDLGLSTSAEINTWLKTQHDNGTPLQVCGELVEPIYIQIDPVQIKTLRGYNAIRAGTDEAVAVAYWTH